MTTSLKVKVVRKALVKLKVLPKFPANIVASNFVTLTKAGNTYTLGADYTVLTPGPISDPTTAMVAVLDETAGVYRIVSLSSLIASAAQIEQHITEAGPVTVLNNAGIARVDQTVGAAITINLPAAANKTCPVLVCDWKGDAGTNNITIAPNGSEKIQGQSSWIIGADTGSVFLRPIAGVGYVL